MELWEVQVSTIAHLQQLLLITTWLWHLILRDAELPTILHHPESGKRGARARAKQAMQMASPEGFSLDYWLSSELCSTFSSG